MHAPIYSHVLYFCWHSSLHDNFSTRQRFYCRMVGTAKFQVTLVAITGFLTAFSLETESLCDLKTCCCVDFVTATQLGNTVTLHVSNQSGSRCSQNMTTIVCHVRGNNSTVCANDFSDPSFGVVKSGKYMYILTDFDNDRCNSRLYCRSGLCASGLNWSGRYVHRKLLTQSGSWHPVCDPTRCCCASSASVFSNGSALRATYKPAVSGCSNRAVDIGVDCKVLGDLYMSCANYVLGYGVLLRKMEGRPFHYVYHYHNVCNSVLECTSGECIRTGIFIGQYRAVELGNGSSSGAASRDVTAAGLYLVISCVVFRVTA
ncbi:uncharacterized protein LOC134180698 [Corticium candelabrum]|uniref:uncharacterized protein LOC134180698 n=1 Tax=Corticium candelabrum TaxID=121492 RepID=UPI002E259BDD|nr:uncharacterized protein LOC134180698 [Corticium candelabrum]